jgi:hypothetical protein
MYIKEALNKFLIPIVFITVLLFCSSALALQINHNGTTLNGTEPNFTFANSIWVNTGIHDSSFNSSNSINYLLIEDIAVSGSFQISSPLSQSDAQISLYRLNGSSSPYTSTLVKTWSGASIIARYYIAEPGKYLVEVSLPEETYPRVSFDFFPDNQSGECIHLAPDTNTLTCQQSWLPAHYRKEVQPWMREQVEEIKSALGLVSDEKRINDFSYFLIDSSIDAYMASSGAPGAGLVIGKKAGQIVRAKLGWEDNNLGFAIDQGIQHGIVIGSLLTWGWNPADPNFYSSWAGVAQQLSADAQSIWSNATGILEVDELEERFNEAKIAWVMLETYIQENYGDWNLLIIRAGLDPADNPTVYEIIDGVAESLGFVNSFFDTAYDLEAVNALFYQGVMEFGDWLSFRSIIDNPLADVDGDGYSNKNDSAPNDPLKPGQPIVNRPPMSVILPSDTISVKVNTTINLNGSGSNDPDGDAIISYQWVLLKKPIGSALSISGSTASSISFVPDLEGSYTLALTVSDGDLSHTVHKSVAAYHQYSTEPILLPEQKIIGPISGGANSSRYYYIDVPDTGVTKLIIWMYGSSKATTGPADIYVSYNKNPTVAFTHPYDPTVPVVTYQYGDPNDLSREQFDIMNPKVGRYHLLLYGFMGSYSNVNLFYQFERGVPDADSDNVPDINDAFPNDPAASLDSDGDGCPDAWNPGKSAAHSTTNLRLDAFPNDPAASLDGDGDGYPDAWNPGKSAAHSTTNLRLDTFPNEPTEWSDSDDDGIGDNTDFFPTDPAASLDSDEDGYPNNWNPEKSAAHSTTGLRLDAFPNDPAASLDSDGDGYPDSWNSGKMTSDSTTGLLIDLFPGDPTEWADSDSDGVGNYSDWAPNDPKEWADSDGDGVGDNADVAPNDPNRQSNIAPVLTPINNRDIEIGNSVSIALELFDEDGDEIIVSLLAAPAFVSLENSELLISPNTGDAGEYQILIKVADKLGGTTAEHFWISVFSTCIYTISPTSQSFSSNAGTGSISVAASPGCDWIASENANWLSISTGLSGSGNGSVHFALDENESNVPRHATITIAGNIFNVSQSAPQSCSYNISPQSQHFTADSGSGIISVTTSSGCDWAAADNSDWITITAGSIGSGDGSVQFAVSQNSSSSGRSAIISVAGNDFEVTQSANPGCSYTISPLQHSFSAKAGNGTVIVSASPGCKWTAAENSMWITLTYGTSGNGNGSVQFSVDPNSTSVSRNAIITVAGQQVSITQSANSHRNMPWLSLLLANSDITNEKELFVGSISLAPCELKELGVFKVASDEAWKEINILSMAGDLILLIDGDESPSRQGVPPYICENGYAESFDSDWQKDFLNYASSETCNLGWHAGDRIRISLFSYGGVSNHSIEIKSVFTSPYY